MFRPAALESSRQVPCGLQGEQDSRITLCQLFQRRRINSQAALAGNAAAPRGMIFTVLESWTDPERFTDEMDWNCPAGDRSARGGCHLLDHRLETFYRPQSPSANRAQVRGKPDPTGPRPISGRKP